MVIPATINKIETLSDRSLRIKVTTQELAPDVMAELMNLYGKYGYFAFSETETIKIPDEPIPEFKEDKSPSQRLRATMYILWNENTDKSKPFNQFYNEKIEAIITKIKEQL